MKKLFIFLLIIIVVCTGVYFLFPQQVGEIFTMVKGSVLGMFSAPGESISAMREDDGINIVMIDPGHGGADPGAVSADGSIIEKDVNLKIANQLAIQLEQKGIKVYITRSELSDKETMSLDDRVALAEKRNADLYISLHNNANYKNYSGAEIYVSGRGSQSAKSSHALAESMLAELGNIGMRQRGVFYRMSQAGFCDERGRLYDYYAVLRMSDHLGIPALLVEHAFLNELDRDFITNDDKIKQIAKAEAKAIFAHFNIENTENSSARTPANGDVDNDRTLSSSDVENAISAVLCSPAAPTKPAYNCADFDADGLIGAGDLLALDALVKNGTAPAITSSEEKTANQPRTDVMNFSSGDQLMLWVQIGDWQNLSSVVGTIDYNPVLFDFNSCPDMPEGLTIVEDSNFGVLRYCYIAPEGKTAPTELTFIFTMRGTPQDEHVTMNSNIYSGASLGDAGIIEYSPSTAFVKINK